MAQPFWCAIILIASITSRLILKESVAAGDRQQTSYGLQDILALAAERNPAIAGAEGAVAQNRGQRVAAAAYPNPSITASGGRGTIRDPSTGVSITERSVTLEQPLEWPGLRQARQRAAEAGLAGSYAALEDARLIVTADVKVAFYERRIVTVGPTVGEHAGVIKGLQDGEEVVTEGSYALKSEALREHMQLENPS